MVRLLVISSNIAIKEASAEMLKRMPKAEVFYADPGDALERFFTLRPAGVVIWENGNKGREIYQEIEQMAGGTSVIVLRIGSCNGDVVKSKKIAQMLKELMKIIS